MRMNWPRTSSHQHALIRGKRPRLLQAKLTLGSRLLTPGHSGPFMISTHVQGGGFRQTFTAHDP